MASIVAYCAAYDERGLSVGVHPEKVTDATLLRMPSWAPLWKTPQQSKAAAKQRSYLRFIGRSSNSRERGRRGRRRGRRVAGGGGGARRDSGKRSCKKAAGSKKEGHGLVVGVVGAGAGWRIDDHLSGLLGGQRRRHGGVRHGIAVRRLQVPAAQVPAGLRLRALLPAGQPAEVRARPPRLRRQQRDEAAERAPPVPAGGRRELPRLRGRHAPPRPRLRLRRRHLYPPAQPPPAPAGPRPRQVRALQVPDADGAERVAGYGGLHRAQRRGGELHQRGSLRSGAGRVRAGAAVRGRAYAVEKLRGGGAHREARWERRLRVRLLFGDGRRRVGRPRHARRLAVLEARHRWQRRQGRCRAVASRPVALFCQTWLQIEKTTQLC